MQLKYAQILKCVHIVVLACCPQMALTPVQFTTETFNAETNVVSSENNATSASPTMAGCQIRCRAAKRLNWCLCCCMGSVNSQVVTVAKGDSPDDVLSFVYSPHIWCPASNNVCVTMIWYER